MEYKPYTEIDYLLGSDSENEESELLDLDDQPDSQLTKN